MGLEGRVLPGIGGEREMVGGAPAVMVGFEKPIAAVGDQRWKMGGRQSSTSAFSPVRMDLDLGRGDGRQQIEEKGCHGCRMLLAAIGEMEDAVGFGHDAAI
ncbi:hypothetical protein ACLOJK_023949 [Asimina triloba]